MLSFFFVPASKLHKIPQIKPAVDVLIVDFEDAISKSERTVLYRSFQSLNLTDVWIRIPIRQRFDQKIELSFLSQLLNDGHYKIVIPKIKSKKEYLEIFELIKGFSNPELIILVEHPRLLVELPSILENEYTRLPICGLALGSHDFMTFMKSPHTARNIYFPRMQVLYLSKAYDLTSIDIASMVLENEEDFIEEYSFGEEHGFDGKFLVHPVQIMWKNRRPSTSSQLDWATKILNSVPPGITLNEIEPFIVDGRIVEKPHVEQALEIIKRYKKNG